MMKNKTNIILLILGVIPVIWLGIMLAPSIDKGLLEIINCFTETINDPFDFQFCNNTIKTVLFFLLIYIFCLTAYFSTRKNYRKGEEYGSAKWGNVRKINKKYQQMPIENNKILTQNMKLGLDGKIHRRNLNVLVVKKCML